MRSITLTCFLLAFSIFTFAQEDCVNGIDDDGDGFVDLNDADCSCSDNSILNGVFDAPCVGSYPTGWGSIYNQNYTAASACNPNNIDNTPGPPPAPATEIVQLTTSTFSPAANIYQCLNDPLLAGQSYTMSYDFAITSGLLVELNPPPTSEIFIYGIPSCPSDYDALPINCPGPAQVGNMILLDNNEFPAVFDTWENYQFTFTPSQNFEGILLSAPCWGTTGVYMLTQVTNVFIDGDPVVEVEDPFFSAGTSCTQLTATADLSGLSISDPTIQWYLDGVAISGATSSDYVVPEGTVGTLSYALTNLGLCGVSEELEIPLPTNLNIEGSVADNPCEGDALGSINLNITNGTPNYTYTWSTGQNTPDLTNLADGNYTVTVTDSDGCTGQQTFTIETPFIIGGFIADIINADPFTNLGGATIQMTGGAPDFTYLWDNGETTATATSLTGGTHTVVVTDANGCQITLTVEIPYFDLVVSENSNTPSCENECSGALTIFIEGGLVPYDILWEQSGVVGTQVNNLCPGTYNYTVTDGIGNLITSSAEIAAFTIPTLDALIENPECGDVSGGGITITPNGNGPFTYAWDNGSTSPILFNIGAGNYTLTLTDSNGCSIDSVFTVDSQTEFEVEASVENVTCQGENNGFISIDISGGEEPFTYTWANGATTSSISDLSPGVYEVTLEDNAGCSSFESFEIEVQSETQIVATVIDNNCFDEAAGSMELTITGGTGYTIQWEDGSDEISRSGLVAGVYTYELTDSLGCTFEDSFEITEGQEIAYQAEIQEAGCNGSSDGFINLTSTAGASPLSYNWSTGDSVSQIENLSAGTYYLTISDVNGCEKLDSFEISENSDISVSGVIGDITCFGEDDGSLELNITGGTEPYSISWSNQEANNIIENLEAGEYGLTVEDAIGCIIQTTYEIEQPDSLFINAIVETPACFEDEGFISADGVGGVGPYTISWSTGANTNQIPIYQGEEYAVSIVDAKGCEVVSEFSISALEAISVEPLNVVPPSEANNDGSIQIEVSGGTEPYTIEWDNGASGDFITDLGIGIYIATVSDANGCSESITVELTNLPLSFSSTIVKNLCFEDCNAVITMAVSGGITPYEVIWSDGQIGESATELCEGIYRATIVDAIGSEIISEEFQISNPEQLVVLNSTQDVSCVDSMDGVINTQGSGGVAPYEYVWESGFTGLGRAGLSPGSYQVTVTDQNGCEEVAIFEIEGVEGLDLSLDIVPVDCENENGSILVIGENENQYPIRINGELTALNGTNEIQGLNPGTYVISYDVNSNCNVEVGEVTLEAIPDFDFSISESDVTVYEGEEVVLTLEGNNEGFGTLTTIDWIIENTNECVFENSEGLCLEIVLVALENEEVQVRIMDENGCETILFARINVEQEMEEEEEEEMEEDSTANPTLYIPNVFSPNNDGTNDEFLIWSNDENALLNSMKIFDRWGNQIYTIENTLLQNVRSWKGEFNGEVVDPNVFVYIIDVSFENGQTKSFVGDIAVVK